MELVNLDTCIQDAAEAVLQSRCRTVFVVGENSVIHGSVTEGDLVRALLRGLNLKASVRHVMNSTPLVVGEGVTTEELKGLMSREGHLAIPIVDRQRKLIRVVTHTEI